MATLNEIMESEKFKQASPSVKQKVIDRKLSENTDFQGFDQAKQTRVRSQILKRAGVTQGTGIAEQAKSVASSAIEQAKEFGVGRLTSALVNPSSLLAEPAIRGVGAALETVGDVAVKGAEVAGLPLEAPVPQVPLGPTDVIGRTMANIAGLETPVLEDTVRNVAIEGVTLAPLTKLPAAVERVAKILGKTAKKILPNIPRERALVLTEARLNKRLTDIFTKKGASPELAQQQIELRKIIAEEQPGRIIQGPVQNTASGEIIVPKEPFKGISKAPRTSVEKTPLPTSRDIARQELRKLDQPVPVEPIEPIQSPLRTQGEIVSPQGPPRPPQVPAVAQQEIPVDLVPQKQVIGGKVKTVVPKSAIEVTEADVLINGEALRPSSVLPIGPDAPKRIADDVIAQLDDNFPSIPTQLEATIQTTKTPFKRVAVDPLTVFESIPETRIQGETIRRVLEDKEILTSQSAKRIMDILDKNFGRRKLSKFDVKQWSPTSNNLRNVWRVSKEEEKAIVDMLGGRGKIAPIKKDGTIDNRIVELVQAMTEEKTKIQLEAIARKVPIIEPNGTQTLREGVPSMFFSHHPVKGFSLRKVRAQPGFVRAFNKAKQREPDLTEIVFARRLQQFNKNVRQAGKAGLQEAGEQAALRGATMTQDDIQRSFNSGAFANIQRRRVLDLHELGNGSTYDGARLMGMEQDPLNEFFMFMAGGNRFMGVKKMEKMFSEMIEQAAPGSQMQNFIRQTAHRSLGIDAEIPDALTARFWDTMRAVNSSTILQAASLGNIAQFNVLGMRSGYRNLAKTILGKRALVPGTGKALDMQKAGAMYTTMIQEMSRPTTRLGRVTKAMLYESGFTPEERAIRFLGGHTGAIHGGQMAKQLNKAVAKPGSNKFKQAERWLKLGGMTDDEIVTIAKRGTLTEEQSMRIAKRVADEVGTRRDIRAVPLWANANTAFKRSMLQFSEWALSNTREQIKLLQATPGFFRKARFLTKATVGTLAFGELARDLQIGLLQGENPFSKEHGTSKLTQKLIGDSFAARLAERYITGIGNVATVGMFTLLTARESKQIGDIISTLPIAALPNDMIRQVYNLDKILTADTPLDQDIALNDFWSVLVRRTPGIPFVPAIAAGELREERDKKRNIKKAIGN